MREGAVIGRTAFGAAILFALAAGCAPKVTPVGGLMVLTDKDKTLAASQLVRLSVVVSSLDGTTTYRDAGYPIGVPDATVDVRFPTRLFVESDGNPNAGVALTLGLWDEAGPIDLRHYEVSDLPTDRVAVLEVLFGLHKCPPLVQNDQVLPGCASALAGKDLPTFGADASEWPFEAIETGAAAEATVNESAEAGPDTTIEDAESGAPDITTPPDSNEEAAPEASGTTSVLTCNQPCFEGQTHCVDGNCKTVPPSCLGGGAGSGFNCGSDGKGDCCESQLVPLTSQGSFLRDYDSTSRYRDATHPATVSQFRLDVYEVTVGRFRKFVDATAGGDSAAPWLPQKGSGKHAHLNGGQGLTSGGDAGLYESGWDLAWNQNLPNTRSGWDAALLQGYCHDYDAFPPSETWTSTSGSDENLPLTCVNWYQAYAFCIWDDGFLPSSAEWNYAAAGGSDQRVFAWGDGPVNPSYAIYNCYYGAGPFGNNCLGLGNIAPVGSVPLGRGLWGQLDLSGSVYEWTLDYDGFYVDPCQDCAVLSGNVRILRGGGFDSQLSEIQISFRDSTVPESSHGDVGFRCARIP